MNRKLIVLAVAAAVAAGPAILAASGPGRTAYAGDKESKLGKLESALKGEGGKSGSKSSLSSGEKGLIAYLLVDFFVNVAPYLLFPRYKYYYQNYPFELGDGYLEYFGDTPYSEPEYVPLNARQITFELRGGYLIDSAELHGWRFYGKTRLSWAFNVDLDFTQLKEWQEDGDFKTLDFTKIDGLFNLSNSPWHDVDLGLGFSYLEGVELYGGGNAKLTGDIFPVKPLAFHFTGGANLFPGGTLFEVEAAVGVFLQRFEFRLGWRSLWVENIEIHGPMSEIAIWF